MSHFLSISLNIRVGYVGGVDIFSVMHIFVTTGRKVGNLGFLDAQDVAVFMAGET